MIKVPGYNEAWMVVQNCEYYDREKVAIAINTFYLEWLTKFGDSDGKVLKGLNEMMITFDDKTKRVRGYGLSGLPFEGRASGLTLTPHWVWVRVEPNERLCETSLVHELVHAAIWALKGTDADPDHEGKKYTGWTVDHSMLIQEVNDSLCVLGI